MPGTDDDLPVPLPQRAPRGQSLLAGLETYWRSLIRGGRLPQRTDIDPGGIDDALPWCFVAEKVAPQVVRLRVAGHRLTDALGMEPRGMPLCSFFSPEARAVLGPLVDRTFAAPAVTELPLISARRLVRRGQTARLLMLPLCDHAGSVNRMIGALVCDGPPGQGAARFDIAPGAALRCDPVVLTAAPPRLAAVGGGHGTGPGVARPALRLVVSNG
jgi:hypothetical protein